MSYKLIIRPVAVTLMLLLTACGYHLRGAIDIPEQMKAVYLEGVGGKLAEEFKSSLKSAGGELVSTPSEAGVVIRILKDDMRRRVLSLSSIGKANEFELNYIVRFMLLDSQGKVLMEAQDMEIDRDYFNDQEDILAKNNEEAVIRDELYRQAVRTIVGRARAVLKN